MMNAKDLINALNEADIPVMDNTLADIQPGIISERLHPGDPGGVREIYPENGMMTEALGKELPPPSSETTVALNDVTPVEESPGSKPEPATPGFTRTT